MTLGGLISPYLNDLRANLAAESTINAYRARLTLLMEQVEGNSTDSIREWVKSYKDKGYSPNSIKLYLGTLKAFIRWANEHGLLPVIVDMPKIRLMQTRRTEREAITPHDYAKLRTYACTRTGPAAREWATMIRLGWDTGLRLGDCASLKKAALNREKLCIEITPEKTKRLGTTLTIPISQELYDELMFERDHYYMQWFDYCLPAIAMQYRIDRHKSLSVQFGRIAKAIGLNKSFHCLRHGVVTRLVERGVNPALIASITGHSLKQIMAYCHPSLDSKRIALDIANPIAA